MFRLPFARRPDEADPEELRDTDEMWPLPDMEVAPPSPAIPAAPAAPFHFEQSEVHPQGSFPAELATWRKLPGGRVGWGFLTEPAGAPTRPRSGLQEFVTGTTYRADNNLCHLLSALGCLPPAEADAASPQAQAELEATLSQLNPDALIGRRCCIDVEHVRDELGNVTARVAGVAPLEND